MDSSAIGEISDNSWLKQQVINNCVTLCTDAKGFYFIDIIFARYGEKAPK